MHGQWTYDLRQATYGYAPPSPRRKCAVSNGTVIVSYIGLLDHSVTCLVLVLYN